VKVSVKGWKSKEKCPVGSVAERRRQSIKEPTAKGWIADGKIKMGKTGKNDHE
jgi:hypothetical protein